VSGCNNDLNRQLVRLEHATCRERHWRGGLGEAKRALGRLYYRPSQLGPARPTRPARRFYALCEMDKGGGAEVKLEASRLYAESCREREIRREPREVINWYELT
jgi:hypothetical protein